MGNLSRFKKLVGNLGKRVYNWRETKESMIFFSFMYETILHEYADLFSGDYEEAMDTYIEMIEPMSMEVVTKLLTEVKVMGVAFKSFITKNLKDLPYIMEMSIHAMFGSWGSKIFGKPILISAMFSDQDVDTIILKIIQCPFCNFTMLNPEQLGTHNYGKLLCLTIEQMLQAVEDFAGNEYKVIGREVKCCLNGDPTGEMRFWLYPPDKLHLMEANEYLKKVK